MFCDLRYVVIDEVHSLMRGDRGGQTLCLIERLSRMAGVQPRRIGLSATIGDPERTGAFLSQGTGRDCVIPRFEEPRRVWRISMEHFYNSGPQAQQRGFESTGPQEAEVLACERIETAPPAALPVSTQGMRPSGQLPQEERRQRREQARGKAAPKDSRTSSAPEGEVDIPQATEQALLNPTDTAPDNADPGMSLASLTCRRPQVPVFANSREEAEATSMLRSYCESRHEPDRFLIHHGNLSASLRETAEELMRDEEQAQTTVTTSTLELGIDIGRLERAFQIDAPFTVSSFLQRMGRTGRRDLPPEMWFVMREEEPEPRTMMPETIPWEALQGIAPVQLYRERSGSSCSSSIDFTVCSITRPCRRLPAPESSRRPNLPNACSRSVISTASQPMTIAYCCATSSRSTTSRSPRAAG